MGQYTKKKVTGATRDKTRTDLDDMIGKIHAECIRIPAVDFLDCM